jgi:hypothetical protein
MQLGLWKQEMRTGFWQKGATSLGEMRDIIITPSERQDKWINSIMLVGLGAVAIIFSFYLEI